MSALHKMHVEYLACQNAGERAQWLIDWRDTVEAMMRETLNASAPREKYGPSLPAAYSAEALASAVGEWAAILAQIDARLGAMGVPEPIAVATCRSLVRAMSEAMRFTSLAAKEAHEQNEKEEKSR